MRKLGSVLLTVYKTVIANVFAAIVGVLTVISGFFTCYIDRNEKTYFVQDSVWKNIAILLVALCALYFSKRAKTVQRFLTKIETDKKLFQKFRCILLMAVMGICAAWILTSQYTPGSDQAAIQNAVSFLRSGDYSSFAPDGYLSQNVHQLGLVWICYVLSFLIGSQNYIALQLLNAGGIVLVYHGLSSIGARFGMSRVQQLEIILWGILFFPLLMYSSFLYGNVCGLAFSIIAIKKVMDYFESGKWIDALMSVLAMILSVMLKTNFLVFMIGMIVLIVEEAIRRKNRICLFIPVFLIVGVMAQSNGIRMYFERVTGFDLEGSSYLSYVAMGLQESETRAPGWYNKYVNNSWKESGYDKVIQGEMAKNELEKRAEHFIKYPGDAVSFFLRKTASQWNNPTFQCYNIVQWRESLIEQSSWIKNFVSTSGAHRGAIYLDTLVFLLLMGAFGYCILFRKKEDLSLTLGLAVIFIGGFFFHLFWEAKGQYTLPYFILLIPYAVAAYSKFGDCLVRTFETRKPAKKANKFVQECAFLLGAVIVIFLSITVIFTGGRGEVLKVDTESYRIFLENEG